MIPSLVFDIETIPDIAGIRCLAADAPEEYGALPDHASDGEVYEALRKIRQAAGLSDFLPHYLQRVAVISCGFRDRDGFRIKSLVDQGEGEAGVIQAFFRIIEKYTPRLISWNGNGFDLPVLHYRGLIHGVQAPRYWDMGDDDREFRYNHYIGRYHTRHLDLMDLLAKYSGRANAPLDKLTRLCGFPGKMGIDGSQVWQVWQNAGQDDIRRYCETDVVNTYFLFCRFQRMRGQLSIQEYDAEMRLIETTLAGSDEPHWASFLSAWKSRPLSAAGTDDAVSDH